eukprot:TRINITY_DN4650_c0_g3_i1.p1 TRINITY_DN4650_c0_g3~~TRINITY_DN4650_c0_g3_i1.p1  ORF type:complete len:337 (+),score=114.06 TRINITY_DN4650_c0_g3_i1:78-1088(+)
MAVDMFLYVPIDVDVKAEGYETPNARVDVPKFIRAINEKAKEVKDPEATNENNDDGRRRGNEPDNSKELMDAHSEPLWTDVLAWSWGMSNSGSMHGGSRHEGRTNVQDISMTRYSDFRSEAFSYYLGKNIVLPHVILRLVYPIKKQKILIQELEMVNVIISSLSTGGSGGESRLTENITLNFQQLVTSRFEFNTETEDVITYSTFYWDDSKGVVTRGGTGVKVESLADMAKAALKTEDKEKVEETVELNDASPFGFSSPPMERRKKALCVAPMGTGKFRKVHLTEQTLEALKKAAGELLGLAVKEVYSVYNKDFSTLIETDQEVKELGDESLIFVE